MKNAWGMLTNPEPERARAVRISHNEVYWEVTAYRWSEQYQKWFFAYGSTGLTAASAIANFRRKYGPACWAAEAA